MIERHENWCLWPVIMYRPRQSLGTMDGVPFYQPRRLSIRWLKWSIGIKGSAR